MNSNSDIDMLMKQKKRRGTFLGALSFFVFFFLVIMAGLIATAYANRDRLLLEYLRQEATHVLNVEVFALESIVTRPIGPLSVEIRNLVFQSSKASPTLRATKVLLSTPKNLLGLYQLVFSRETLALKAQFIGVHIDAHIPATTQPILDATEPQTLPFDQSQKFQLSALPFPVKVEAEFRDSAIEVGPQAKPVKFKNITGILRVEITNNSQTNVLLIQSSGQLALGIGVGERSQLPIRTEWSFSAQPEENNPTHFIADISSLSISTLGIVLKSRGRLKWPEQTFNLEAAGITSDLGVLPVDKSESEALGLTGRLKGSAEVSLKASGSLAGLIKAEGLIKLKDGHFPFDLLTKSPSSIRLKGPAEIDLETPFKFAYNISSRRFENVDLQLATFKIDLTAADLQIPGILNKPAQVMFSTQGKVTAQGETVEVNRIEFRLANLLAAVSGQVSIDPKRHSKLDLTLTLPSLKGWPNLLPILGKAGTSGAPGTAGIAQAQGSFAFRGQVELPLGAPETMKSDSRATIDSFEANGLEVPLAYNHDKHIIEGVLRGSLRLVGSLASSSTAAIPITWSLKRAQGLLDLKDLRILWNDSFDKQRGQETAFDFVASAPPNADPKKADVSVKIEKLNVRALSSTASIRGTLHREDSGDINIDSTLLGRLVLSELYELNPSLRSVRAKFPAGTLVTNLQTKGTYKLSSGLKASPLTVSGRIALKAPQAFLLDLKPEKSIPAIETSSTTTNSVPSEFDSFFKWPVLAKSNLEFDLQFESVALKAAAIKQVAILARLQNGDLRGAAVAGQFFGGATKISSFAVLNLPQKNTNTLRVSMAGNFQQIDLSHFAEFLSPQWKNQVGGLASGNFTFNTLPMSKLPMTATTFASGSMAITGGSLSTVSLDQMVNLKLAELPGLEKNLGKKPVIATRGVNLNIKSNFDFAKGRMTLKGLSLLSPENNELALNGWIQTDLTTELTGFAYLTDTPVGGSFRQANSDKLGRLVVPVKLSGALNHPSMDIAADAIAEMTKRMIALERSKLEKTIKKEATKGAIDAVKEELKKRGLSF